MDEHVPEDRKPTPELASELAQAIALCLNTLAVLAAPRVFLQHADAQFCASVPGIIDRVLQFQLGDQPFTSVEPLLREIHNLARALELQRLPPEITEKARACLEGVGVPTPPEGWDDFEGWPEEATE
jgi:hypothetical protein